MRRLLWVTAIAPCFDARGGGEIRQAHLLDAVADRFEVRLLVAGALEDERVRRRLSAVTEVPVGPATDPDGRLRRRLRDLRWEVVQRQSDEVARQRGIRGALRSHIERLGDVEVVCIEYIGLAPLLPPRRRAVWALTLHNLPSAMAGHNARIAPGRRHRLMSAIEQRNSRRIERRAARDYDVVVAVSADDARLLGNGAVVVPNGVDTERFQPDPLPHAGRVVFTGGLHTVANRDGIKWFCDDVWPRVRASAPHATLDVVGSRPPADVLALGALDGVRVHGDVEDVVPFLRAASVAVVPLRIGSGSRLKALEAMAAGRPVVGTAIGLGGLELLDGRDALIADGAAQFAAAIVRCLEDRPLAAQLAAAGRTLVERRYSWNRIGADYAALLEARVQAASSSTSETIATN